jgi:hypothetical protein
MTIRTAALAAAVLLGAATFPCTAAAQVVETPQAFDGAGRILRLTPAAADSLALRPPLFPVSGDFVSARLCR